MAKESKEPTPTTEKGPEIPSPKRADWDAMLDTVTTPADGPPEIEDAARQEVEYPADETDEG